MPGFRLSAGTSSGRIWLLSIFRETGPQSVISDHGFEGSGGLQSLARRRAARARCHPAKEAPTPRAQVGRALQVRAAARYRPRTAALGFEERGQRT